MQYATGSYTGNGSDNRNVVTGLAFSPGLVIIAREPANYEMVFRSLANSGDASHRWTGGGGGGTAGSLANGIQAFNSDGFQVGNGASVNNNLQTYRWWAFEHDATCFDYGTYAGNSAARTISTAIKLDFVLIAATTSIGILIPMYGMRTLPAGEAVQNNFTGGTITTAITSFGVGTGFNLGTYAHVNRTGDNYAWFGFGPKTGQVYQSTFTGNGTDNRNITMGDPFQPVCFFCRSRGAITSPNNTWFRHPDATGGGSSYTDGINQEGDRIQAINSNGFQVGTNMDVNNETYHYLALLGQNTPPYSQYTPPGEPFSGTGFPGYTTGLYERYKNLRKAAANINNIGIYE